MSISFSNASALRLKWVVPALGKIYSYASDRLRPKPVSSHGASSKFKLSGAAADVNPRSNERQKILRRGLALRPNK
jgi:hypothetical protein